MADYLASIFGTEKDKVNCSFYFKIGACRHGERCSRIHNKPTFSQTILLQNLYQNPQNVTETTEGTGKEQPRTTITRVHTMSDEAAQEHFDDFFEDVFIELEDKYGEIEEMNVCDNLGDHLVGNVYVKFRREEDAERAVTELNNRWFGGRAICAELSPVTDFREACCRQYEMGECTRSGFCNFMHIKPISRELRRELYGRRRAAAMERRSECDRYMDRRSRSRSIERRRSSRDRDRDRGRERDRERKRDRDRDKDRERDRDRDSKRKSSSSRHHRSSRSRSRERHRSSKHSKDHRDRHDDNNGNNNDSNNINNNEDSNHINDNFTNDNDSQHMDNNTDDNSNDNNNNNDYNEDYSQNYNTNFEQPSISYESMMQMMAQQQQQEDSQSGDNYENQHKESLYDD